MTNPDIRAAFEAWYAKRHPNYPTSVHENPTWAHASKMDDLEVWQAATEANKATGVAVGELMPSMPKHIYGDKHCFIPCPPERCDCKSRNRIAWEAQEAARQPAPALAGCRLCGSAIGHDLNCPNHPVNAKAPFEQDDEHKAFLATYLDSARKASDNTSAEMILWHANRHWNGKAGEMWRARAALAATAAPVLSDEQIDRMAGRNGLYSAMTPDDRTCKSMVKRFVTEILAATRSQP